MTAGALDGAVINEDKCRAAASDPCFWPQIWRTIWWSRVSFQAGSSCGRCLGFPCEEKKVQLPELSDADALSVSSELGDGWREVFDLDRAFAKREKPGMPGPQQVAGRIAFWEKILQS